MMSITSARALLQDGRTMPLMREDDVSHLGFRILRGVSDKDFETMTDTPEVRRIIQLAPLSGSGMFGKSGYDMLLQIGYDPKSIEGYVRAGKKFKMVIFELGPDSPVKRATWVNVTEAIKKAYPEIDILKDHVKLANVMRNIPFENFEKMFGGIGSFDKIKGLGSAHPLFVTLDKLMQIQEFEKSNKLAIINAAHIRLWMFLAMNFNALFSGDGHTWTSEGKNGVDEFVMANVPLTKLGKYELFDLQITLP